MTADRAPFRLIQRSHISFHAESSPYRRYISHPEEITLTVPAGTAVIVPSLLMHGSHPNCDDSARELLQFGYRPDWAGPAGTIEEWDPDLVANAPDITKPFLKSPNTTEAQWEQPHKPPNMERDAPGINPSRWDD